MADSSSNAKELLSLDPYSIKKSLVNLFEKNFGVENTDTYEAGFAGYMIQALTCLSSDTLSNLAFSWSESFTTKAKLRSTVNSLATMFDYKIVNASPCQGSMTVQIEFPSNSTTTYKTVINNGSLCSDSSIQYLVNGTYIITIGNKSSIKRRNPSTGIITDVPFSIIVKDSVKYISFSVSVQQMKIFEHDFTFSDVTNKKFYDVNVSGFEDSIYNQQVGVYITEDNSNYSQFIKFTKVDNIYSAGSTEKVYTLIMGKNNTATIRFGNGIFGYQPQDGQSGKIILYTTMGAAGSVIAGSLNLKNRLTDTVSNLNLNVTSSNLAAINNGTNEEELETMKNHIIQQISAAKRLVTEDDYNSFEGVLQTTDINMYPLLLRRDTNANEIDMFSVFYDNDGKPVPTTSLSLFFDSESTVIPNSKVYRVYYIKGADYKVYNAYTEIPTHALSDGNKYYIDDDYDTAETAWFSHNGEMAIYNDPAVDDGDGGTTNWTFELLNSENKVEYVCPYNIQIDGDIYKRAKYEYIPSKLNLSSTLKFETDDAGIQMSVLSTLINVLPEAAFSYDSVDITHYNMIHTVLYSTSMTSSDINFVTTIKSSDVDETIDKSYEFKVLSNDSIEGNMQISYNIPVDDIPYIEWATADPTALNPNILTLTTTLKYKGIVYNTYQRKIIIRESSLSINENYFNTELDYIYNDNNSMTLPSTQPQLETVSFGISSILFNWTNWKNNLDETINGYEMLIYLYKLGSVDSTKINCELELAGSIYSPYTYGVGGNNTILVYRIHIPYDTDAIPTGSLNYTISFGYKFAGNMTYSKFSSYTGTVIARQVLNNTTWSTMRSLTDPDFDTAKYKIYKIPVIEKNFYDDNKDFIEEKLLYVLAEIDYNFNKYKMLTDSINIKYATTCGLTENLKYNTSEYDENDVDTTFIYNDWAWDIAPTLKAKIIISKDSEKNDSEIINECKEVIFSFLTMKATGFVKSIIKSDITRYIHDTIPEIMSCEITEPFRDIIYIYNEINLPRDKDLLLSYTPEFMWIDKDKISVTVINIPS